MLKRMPIQPASGAPGAKKVSLAQSSELVWNCPAELKGFSASVAPVVYLRVEHVVDLGEDLPARGKAVARSEIEQGIAFGLAGAERAAVGLVLVVLVAHRVLAGVGENVRADENFELTANSRFRLN